jgi:hypothetical protein
MLGQSRIDAALGEASYQRTLAISGKADPRPAIQAAREEYEAMTADALQQLFDDARAEDARKAQAWVTDVQANREQRWPHWAKKDLWSEAEFAALCCGFVPDNRGTAGDPGRVAGDDSHPIAINSAADDIRRGTLSRTLAFVSRDDADTAAHMYGTARHYVPAIAAEWAAQRFDTFPASLLAAVRQRVQATPAPIASGAAHDKPLDTRERTTLLCIIGALARQQELDLSQPSKTGDAIAAMAPELKWSGRAIGEHLKGVSDAMASRTR